MNTKKKVFIIFLIIVIAFVLVFSFFYMRRPDLVIQGVTFSKNSDNPDICEYTIEIKNRGFAPVNDFVSYCYWPEGKEKCRFLEDVVNHNPETGKTSPLILAPGEKYSIEIVPLSKNKFGGECPDKLYFCIDCNLHIEYEKEIIDGSVEEINENNNDYIYTR